MDASVVDSQIIIDCVIHDGSSRIHSEVNKNILSAHLQRNVSKQIGRNVIIQQVNDPKHTANATKDFIMEKKWKSFDWPSQSPDLKIVGIDFTHQAHMAFFLHIVQP